jgi:hypothetical protein
MKNKRPEPIATKRKPKRGPAQEAPADPPTTAELYMRAQRTSHLELGERRGDVDRIIAAGLSGGLGMTLFRLLGEYQMLDHTIKVSSPSNDRRTHRLLIYMDLGSLYGAKQALWGYAEMLAAKNDYAFKEDALRALVGRCIDVFLDTLCGTCSGARVTGAYGGIQPPCRDCRGTGKRDCSIGKTLEEQAFAGRLLRDMEAMASEAEQHSRLNLRAVDAAKRKIEEDARSA